jgi:UDP-glucuronate 4-epimerase
MVHNSAQAGASGMRLLLTGVAGFIGYHAAEALLGRGHEIVGADSLNSYYDPALKRARVARLAARKCFRLIESDIADAAALDAEAKGPFDVILHLAAQAGVRYALHDSRAYTRSNLVGHHNILELARGSKTLSHLIYASSSSVYGNDTKPPYREDARADKPISYYGATKRAGELMSHSYAELFGLKQTGLRFFTVYGPWGRPDMALFLFARNILAGKPIDVFNRGHHRRDFTYVDDIVEGIVGALDHVATPNPAWDSDAPDPGTSRAPYRLYNIGNSQPVELLRYIELLEQQLGRTAEKNLLPLQPGDVPDTWADVEDLARDVGYRPSTPVEVGVARFVEWYLEYHGITLQR